MDRTRNPYSYAGNSPVDTTDPSGLCVHVLGQPVGSDCPWSERLDAATSYIPIYGQIHAAVVTITAFIGCAGVENAWTCAVTGFNPAYAAIDGTGRFVGDIQSGCSGIAMLNDGGEAVSGAVGTVATATTGGVGIAGVLRARLSSLDIADETGAIRPFDNGEPLSPNQMNAAIKKGQAPKGIVRVDTPKVPGEQTHVHLSDGSALNRDGTWKHGGTLINNKQAKWLQANGWTIPQ